MEFEWDDAKSMSRTRLTIGPDNPQGISSGRVDHEVLDATSEEDIARQARRRRRRGDARHGTLCPPRAPASWG